VSRTFLALCRDVVSDLGIAGGILQSTQQLTNQEQIRICNWVARSDLYLQNLWTQWNFLWVQDSAVKALANTSVATPVTPSWAQNIQTFDLESLWINAGTSSAHRIPYLEWRDFYRTYQMFPKATQPVPSFFSVDPSGVIWLSSIVPADTLFSMEYYVVGKQMTLDGSTSPIPANFDTIICERAKIIYAGRENAQEIMTSASAEYTDQLDKMQAYCLPENTAGRTLRNNPTTAPQAYVE
jgi:hypothetical protein